MNMRGIILIMAGIAVIAVASATILLTRDRTAGETEAQLSASEDNDAREDAVSVPPGKKRYVHPSFLFSLLVPDAMRIEGRHEQGGAETVIFMTPNTDPPQDFQLYIVPYGEDTITSSQIQKDTHGRAIGTPQEVVLGSGVRGIVFESEDPMLGRLREIWFLMSGHLYEVTTYAGNDEWIAEILNTLEPNRP